MPPDVGVDEAGKGPVLGSMFVAAVRAPADAVADAADSKTVAPDRRRAVADRLRADPRVRTAIVEVPPDRIDAPDTDMNGLTTAAHADAVDAVAGASDAVLLDAADTDADRFVRRVADGLDRPEESLPTLDGEHGADERAPVVGAASILAKARRDAHVDAIADRYGDVGSGYPSDPATRAFLRDWVRTHGDLPPPARTSWGTCRDVLAAAEQASLDGF